MALPLNYHWKNLFARKSTTLLTMLVLAAVIGVFDWMMGFRQALVHSLSVAGDARKLIVMKPGATAESNSAIGPDEFNKLRQLSEIAMVPGTSDLLLSPEALVQISLPRTKDGGKTFANVAVRGVTDAAFQVHRNVKVFGRSDLGSREVIVGQAASGQFAGLRPGDVVNLGYENDQQFTVVGLFSADGGPMESEIWGNLDALRNAYNRTMYSSASLRLKDGADAQAVIQRISDPAIQLNAQTEADYWVEQAKFIQTYIIIAQALVVVMSLAAAFSIANTMFSTVTGRSREIAMLRTIGYSGGQVLSGFILESIMLSLIGGMIGCIGCVAWLQLVGNTKDMFGATTFTTMAFEIHLGWLTIVLALVLVTVVGAAGALVPARRAARMDVITALREP